MALRIATPFKSMKFCSFHRSLHYTPRNGTSSRLAPLRQSSLLYTHHPDWRRSQSSLARPSPEDEQLFQYTSGRFIHDEARQLAERYVPFNVAALKDLAASTCGAQRAVDITKASESKWSKELLVTLDDGAAVVAHLPTRCAPPPRYYVPNLAATTEYVRTRLGLPVPRVLAWSADGANPVGAPYVLTEAPRGTNLALVWDALSDALKDAAVVECVRLEARMMAAVADGYGSIFYRGDVPTAYYDLYTGDKKEEEFVVGPDLAFWNSERRDLDIDRGPFATALECLLALSAQERVWLKHYAIPKEEYGFFDPPAEAQQPEIHLNALDRFDTVAPYLIPQDPDLFRPMLRLTGLDASNLFISQEALDAGRIEITSVQAWHCKSLGPLFQTASVPNLFFHDPTPPEQQVAPVYDAAAEEVAARRHALYVEMTRSYNPALHKALAWPPRVPLQQTIQSVPNMWEEGCLNLMFCLYRLYRDWAQLVDPAEPCPLQYTQEEFEWARAVSMEFQERNDFRVVVARALGVDRSGEVHPDMYDRVLEASNNARDKLADDLWREHGVDREFTIRSWPWKP